MWCSYPVMHRFCMVVLTFVGLWWLFKGNNWQISLLNQNFTVCIFLDAVSARSFNICMIVTLIELFPFVISLLTMTLVQDHTFVRKAKLQVLFSLQILFFFSFFHEQDHTSKLFMTLACIERGCLVKTLMIRLEYEKRKKKKHSHYIVCYKKKKQQQTTTTTTTTFKHHTHTHSC